MSHAPMTKEEEGQFYQELDRLREKEAHALEIEPPGRHDSGNADLLARLHGERIHYVPPWNEWLAWSGTHWQRDTRAVRIAELAKDVGRTLITLAANIDDNAARGKALSWANQTLGAGRIRSMIELTRGITGIPIDHEVLDADPWLLGVENGVVDLRTGEFRQADPSDLMTMQCPVEWSDDATAPRWEAALEEWFPNPATRAYMHRLVGQALVGLQRDHLFVILYGTGGNGKSTFVRSLQYVLGPYAATPDLALLTETKWGAHDTATSSLFRARLAVASETEKRVKLAEASIKNLTGGDRISARRLYENPWSFTPTHTLWLTTNYQPQITGRDPGIWRRIRVVPWVASFSSKTSDKELDDKLRAEAAGILRWAVAGVAEWLEHGLDESDEVIMATAEYRTSEDLLGRFASDIELEFDPDLTIGKTELADLLGEWTATEGVRLDKSALRDWLTGEHGCREDREDVHLENGKRRRRRIWVGVGIVEKPTGPQETPGQASKSTEDGPDGPGLPETPIESGLYRDFTEDPVHPVQKCQICAETMKVITSGQLHHPGCCPIGCSCLEADRDHDNGQLDLDEYEAETLRIAGS